MKAQKSGFQNIAISFYVRPFVAEKFKFFGPWPVAFLIHSVDDVQYLFEDSIILSSLYTDDVIPSIRSTFII